MRIFISYGHDDNSELVLRFRRDLQAVGHDTWIDVEAIEHGDDWRRKITEGLANTDVVLAFLSRRAVRDAGVCLDELAIALSIPAILIQTVLLEPLTDEELPNFVGRIQRLNMSDWRSHRAQGDAEFASWYATQLQLIASKLEPQPEYRAEIELLEQKLRPVSDGGRAGELLRAGFTGRLWLREEVERWRVARRSRVLCITGEPGIGKSAIAAWLARTYPFQTLALHFCQYALPDSCDPRRVVSSIAFQMARRLPDFRLPLLSAISRLGGSGDEALAKLQPAQAFIQLLAEPAGVCINGGLERHIVIIDGLDEAGEELSQFLADYHARLPDWLGFIVTSRPDESPIRANLQALQIIALDAADTRNLGDASAYTRQWLESKVGLDAARSSVLADAFAEASNGSFVYLSLVRQLAQEQQLSWDALADLQRLPRGLDRLFLDWFKRQFPVLDDYKRMQAPLMRLLVASELPVPLTVVERALGLDEESFHDNVLLPLGSLFRVQRAAVTVFHPTLREWLRDANRAGKYAVSAKLGHAALARVLWRELRGLKPGAQLSPYALDELPAQLLHAGDELLEELLPDAASWDALRARVVELAKIVEIYGANVTALAWRRLIYTSDERLYSGARAEVAANYNALGLLLGEADNWTAAGGLFERAARSYYELRGETDEDVAYSTNLLGLALSATGRNEEARQWYLHALRITRALPNQQQQYLATYLYNFACTLVDSDPKGAQETLELALDLAVSVHGEEHTLVVRCLRQLADVLRERGDIAGSHGLLARAVGIARREEFAPCIETVDFPALLQELAQTDLDRGETKAAVAGLREALALQRKDLGENHLEVAKLEFQLAQALQQLDQHTEALALLTHTLAVGRVVYGADDPRTYHVNRTLASALIRAGRLAEARALYTEMVNAGRKLDANDSGDRLEAALSEFVLNLQLALPEDADALRRAWHTWAPHMLQAGELTPVGRLTVLKLKLLGGSDEAAGAVLRQQLELLQQDPGPLHATTAVCQGLLETLAGGPSHGAPCISQTVSPLPQPGPLNCLCRSWVRSATARRKSSCSSGLIQRRMVASMIPASIMATSAGVPPAAIARSAICRGSRRRRSLNSAHMALRAISSNCLSSNNLATAALPAAPTLNSREPAGRSSALSSDIHPSAAISDHSSSLALPEVVARLTSGSGDCDTACSMDRSPGDIPCKRCASSAIRSSWVILVYLHPAAG